MGLPPRLVEIWAEISDLEHASELAGWDQQVCMPEAASEQRGEMLATLQRLAHERLVAPETAELLAKTEAQAGELDAEELAWLRVAVRRHGRAVRVPGALVAELSRAESSGFAAWTRARRSGRFEDFAPALGRILGLVRTWADTQGAPCRYDALLQEHEPGLQTSRLSALFGELRPALVALVAQIAARPQVSDAPLRERVATDLQLEAGRRATAAFGYDWGRGRQDLSAHPFSTSFGPDDCRITTRLEPENLGEGLFATLHEAGHAIYEQGLPRAWAHGPLGTASSTGVHESQSRLWENMVGRSLPFWEFFSPVLAEVAGGPRAGWTARDLYLASNRVAPSFIRVAADEVTYNLHILLRFELEQLLVDDRLPLAELPAAWNDGMERLLGIRPPSDREGVLQDVHWSGGGFGYFPSYTLGNVLAATWMRQMEAAVPDLWSRVRRGDFAPLLGWLREHIHSRGATLTPEDLTQAVTGEAITARPYLDYVRGKYGEIYGL